MENVLVILTISGRYWDTGKEGAKSWSAPSRNELVSRLWKLANQGLSGGSGLATAANDLKFGTWRKSLSASGYQRDTARISLTVIPAPKV